jgi:hypothetical protein
MKVIQFILSLLIIGSFFYIFTFQNSNIFLKVFIFVLLTLRFLLPYIFKKYIKVENEIIN